MSPYFPNTEHSALLLSIALLTWNAGCWSRTTSTPPVTPPVAKYQVPAAVATAENDGSSEAKAPDEDHQASDTANSSTPSTSASSEPPAAVPPPESHERILLLTPGGPLVIDVRLTIDGRPFDASLAHLAEEAIAAGDTDGDGRTTWKEVLASPKFKTGQFGNNPITPDMTLKSFTEMYDSNRDGQMNAGEVPKFLTKNMAGPHAFSLRSSRGIRGDNVVESPVRRWLDDDEDGQLSAAEIAAAPVRLRARDADDDDLLVPGDFVAPAAELAPGEMPRRPKRKFGPEAAHHLGTKAKWNSVLVSLDETYGADAAARPGAFPLVGNLFERLDADQNGALDKDEVAALATIEPHLKLTADFGRSGEKKEPTARIKLGSLAEGLSTAVRVLVEDDSRLTLALPGTVLEFYCRDAAPGADYTAQAEALLTMYDADKNGYLEKSELPEENAAIAASFDSLDADGDGKVYAADVAALLSRQQAALLGQIQARAGEQEDALFAALDADADGRLTSREIRGAADRLKSLDADGDGSLTVDEIPGSLAVGLVRGDPQADNGVAVAPPPVPRSRPADTPPWFARMDANEDGEISPEEFLGSLEKFRALDANQDGYLSLAELQAN